MSFNPGNQGSSSNFNQSFNHVHVAAGAIANIGNYNSQPGASKIEQLPYAKEAPYNASGVRNDAFCLVNTRVGIREYIDNWLINGTRSPNIFLLHGLAGTGKSTLARTVASTYKGQYLGASFFFSRINGGDVSHAEKFVTTLAVQLAEEFGDFRCALEGALGRSLKITGKMLREQLDCIICGPLGRLSPESVYRPLLLVIDALDECGEKGKSVDEQTGVEEVLELLVRLAALEGHCVKIFVTTRMLFQVETFINRQGESIVVGDLHNWDAKETTEDLFRMASHRLGNNSRLQLTDVTIDTLVDKAHGLFIWMATACRFIRPDKVRASERLAKVLHGTSKEAAEGLFALYATVINDVIESHPENEKEDVRESLREVLEVLVSLSNPLPLHSLEDLLCDEVTEIGSVVDNLLAIIDKPRDGLPIKIHHPSFCDFLRSPQNPLLVPGAREVKPHDQLAQGCLRLMNQRLTRNICRLSVPGMSVSEVSQEAIAHHVPVHLQYACSHWAGHIQASQDMVNYGRQTYNFLSTHFLHWLEALALIRSMNMAYFTVVVLEQIYSESPEQRLQRFIEDARKFTLNNRSIIEQAPLQVYCSSLAFAPTSSIIRQIFARLAPRWISRLPNVYKDWSAVEDLLDGDVGKIINTTFTSDGKTLISVGSTHVQKWDFMQRATLTTIQHSATHKENVMFFSATSSLISAAGTCIEEWTFTTKSWRTVVACGRWAPILNAVGAQHRIACVHADHTVRLWDLNTKALLCTILKDEAILKVAISGDGNTLATTCGLNIDLWIRGHTYSLETWSDNMIQDIALSFDGEKMLVTPHDGMGAHMWNLKVRSYINFTVPEAFVSKEGYIDRHATFSPDGTMVAMGNFKIIWLWRILDDLPVLLGQHTKDAMTPTFSPDGQWIVSGSKDGGILVMHIAGQHPWHDGNPEGITRCSVSNNRVASMMETSILVFDIASGRKWETFQGKVLAPLSPHRTEGSVGEMVEGIGNLVDQICLSPDGSKVAIACCSGEVMMGDIDTGRIERLQGDPVNTVTDISFSPDGTMFVSCSDDDKCQIWSLNMYEYPSVIFEDDDIGPRLMVAFSRDQTVIATISSDMACVVNLLNYNQKLQKYPDQIAHPIALSPDGTGLLFQDNNGQIRRCLIGQKTWVGDPIPYRSLPYIHAFTLDRRFLGGWEDAIKEITWCPPGCSCGGFASLYTLDESATWVMRNGQRVLYLPPSLRPMTAYIRRDCLVMLATNIDLVILKFRENCEAIMDAED
ncbi:hypothetical protein BDV25DRAFT_136742 [Aspergillus avenaceus]|uniref:Nephrocystin 3-like N-terminal domain-containing protein n=1 Tax=Aspergillus avenaceus TaxID=36643 RepID=A0A5N6U4Q1_ASPAV|nr:hypothetical protein BDV25DRAFT_136742 [Aspergillus avenaceus]